MILHYSSIYNTCTATTEFYTLSYTTLFRSCAAATEDGLQIVASFIDRTPPIGRMLRTIVVHRRLKVKRPCHSRFHRSEEHTSELQSRLHLVCRLLLEKKKNIYKHKTSKPNY